MHYTALIEVIKNKVQTLFSLESTGHDWHHILRVYNNAILIHEHEGGNKALIELVALLHDISDHKFNGGELDAGGKVAYTLLKKEGCDEEIALKVKLAIDTVSYKGAKVADQTTSIEAKIVQDADRLDAIGAIGIARAFAYGGNKNRPIYDPTSSPELHDSFDTYTQSKSHTINHFYEKLLLLKDKLHTETAREMAEKRHIFMQQFLDQFYSEWNLTEV
jgi:uncharacterized protein